MVCWGYKDTDFHSGSDSILDSQYRFSRVTREYLCTVLKPPEHITVSPESSTASVNPEHLYEFSQEMDQGSTLQEPCL